MPKQGRNGIVNERASSEPNQNLCLPSRTGEGASACRFPHCGPTAVSAPAPVHGKDSTVIIGLISRFL